MAARQWETMAQGGFIEESYENCSIIYYFAAARVPCGTQLLHLGPILLPPSTLRYPTAAFWPFFAATAVRFLYLDS